MNTTVRNSLITTLGGTAASFASLLSLATFFAPDIMMAM